MVSVGDRSDWNSAVLTDEAVFTAARLVIPFVTSFWPQIDARLLSTIIVRLTFPPVGVAHGMTCEHGFM